MLFLTKLLEPKENELTEKNASADKLSRACMSDTECCHDNRCVVLSAFANHASTDQHQFIDAIWSVDKH